MKRVTVGEPDAAWGYSETWEEEVEWSPDRPANEGRRVRIASKEEK